MYATGRWRDKRVWSRVFVRLRTGDTLLKVGGIFTETWHPLSGLDPCPFLDPPPRIVLLTRVRPYYLCQFNDNERVISPNLRRLVLPGIFRERSTEEGTKTSSTVAQEEPRPRHGNRRLVKGFLPLRAGP